MQNILVFIILSTTLCSSQRVVYNFDFGWKFALGNVANEDLCPANAFPIDLSNYYCPDWAHQAAYGITEAECRLYCCGEPSCAGYSYKDGFCVVGNSIAQCYKLSGYSGAARTVPASVPQPPANGPQSPNFDDSKWENVTVPHDYVVTQAPNPNEEWSHGYRPRNISWYRKHFTLDNSFKNQVLWLEFDGVYRSSDMWLNGQFLGHHSSGYTSFRYRLDNFAGINFNGENVLSVRTDPRSNEGWWYEGAGIYRHTRLVRTNLVHVSPWGVYVKPSVIGPIDTNQLGLLAADSFLEIFVNISNRNTAAATVFANLKIYAFDNSLSYSGSSATVVLKAGETVTVFQSTLISQAVLWDPTQPKLYTLVSALVDSASGSILDSTNTTFGVRKLKFDADEGFFLNDINVKVRGACNHQDFAGVGVGVPDRVNKFRVEKLLSMGVNAWRMSHNPPNPELLDYTDQLGMLVWDENRFLGDFSQWLIDLKDMILRDRNHPSIIWWSLCNEWGCEQYNQTSTISAGLKFRDVLKSLDQTRPISGAWNGDLTTGVVWAQKVCDVMGINYNYGSFDPFHSQCPTIPLISSESCSCTSDRSAYINQSNAIIGPYNAWPCIRDCWQPVATRAFVMGSFDWTAFDYRGEETPTNFPSVNSHFGGIDLSGYEKDAMVYFKAWFLPHIPVAQIVPQDLTYLTSSNDLVMFSCGAAPFRWKFGNSSSVASVIQSFSNPQLCIKGSQLFPSSLAPCNPSDSSFLFYRDDFGQIFYVDGGQKYCMDIYAGTGPQVGFYQCKNEHNTNQDWQYLNTGVIASIFQNGLCVGSGVHVLVYTNGDSVELFVDGVSLGVQSVPPFESAGFLLQNVASPSNVTALARKQGSSWAKQTVSKPGKGNSIILQVERPQNQEPIFSDGQDVALLTASILDSNGNLVRSASDVLTFTVVSGNGRIVGTGNGNPSDLTPDQGNVRAVWNGYARVIVGAGLVASPGAIVVQASAPGFPSTTVSIPTKPRPNVYLL